jgi:hypothetical protein
MAQTRIAVVEKAAWQEIARISSEAQIELLAHGMSEHARQLLENMPKVEALMPTLQVGRSETAAVSLRMTANRSNPMEVRPAWTGRRSSSSKPT